MASIKGRVVFSGTASTVEFMYALPTGLTAQEFVRNAFKQGFIEFNGAVYNATNINLITFSEVTN